MSTPGIIKIATASPASVEPGDVITVHGPTSGVLHMVVVHADDGVLHVARINPCYLAKPPGRLARATRHMVLWLKHIWYKYGWLPGVGYDDR